MQTLAISSVENELLVKGSLTREFMTPKVERNACRLISKNIAYINLSQVTAVDTAGLAWILVMLEEANKANISIELVDLPQDLQNLAKLTAVAGFLPVQ